MALKQGWKNLYSLPMYSQPLTLHGIVLTLANCSILELRFWVEINIVRKSTLSEPWGRIMTAISKKYPLFDDWNMYADHKFDCIILSMVLTHSFSWHTARYMYAFGIPGTSLIALADQSFFSHWVQLFPISVAFLKIFSYFIFRIV